VCSSVEPAGPAASLAIRGSSGGFISEWEELDTSHDDRKLAYILATTLHETADTMQAIHEGFDESYWQSDYADDGYWGRGFVQLTWEDNYENMSDEVGVDLTEREEAALLPAISANVTVDGMLDGDFTGQGLDTYFPVTQAENQPPVQGDPDWYNARQTVNGTVAAGAISVDAQAIYAEIQAYRRGIADETIDAEVTLAQYLYLETGLFAASQAADASRILEALGYMDFTAPEFQNPTEEQQRYVDDVSETGYAWQIQHLDTQAERDALIAFQRDFNANHNLETPLNENGILDEPTMRALLLGGHLIESGNSMIDYAFQGEVDPDNLIQSSRVRYQEGEIDIGQLAAELLSYMPSRQEEEILAIFDDLGGRAAELAIAMSSQAPGHDDLAYINTAILERMRDLLYASSSAEYHAQAQRITAVLTYEPPEPDYDVYIVNSGDTLGAIAQDHGIDLNELAAYNDITDINSIQVGQEIRIPREPAQTTAEETATPEAEQGNDETATPEAEDFIEYTVQPGDTLFQIAQRYGTDVDTLVSINGLPDANQIAVGQVLRIPDNR
jgi:putative chitinase